MGFTCAWCGEKRMVLSDFSLARAKVQHRKGLDREQKQEQALKVLGPDWQVCVLCDLDIEGAIQRRSNRMSMSEAYQVVRDGVYPDPDYGAARRMMRYDNL